MGNYLKFSKHITRFFLCAPRLSDAIVLSIFVILVTFQPFFLRGEINLFELGIYLPGINAILDGQIPYRDFFHLRGPLELYLPAIGMSLFGEKISVLSTYFYIGTVFGLILCVFLGKELYRTRIFLYLMVPVLTGRTFLRVVFHYWGGMRFAIGLLVVLCVVYFFKRKKNRWILLAGTASALALLISAEMGLCCFLALFGTFFFSFIFKIQERPTLVKSALTYMAGLAVVLVPYFLYLLATQSLVPYFQAHYNVLTRMPLSIPVRLAARNPENLKDFLGAFHPDSRYFQHITPTFCYLFFLVYVFTRLRKKFIKEADLSLITLGVYGIVMYQLAFRNILAGQFEMALQPEKIILFLLMEEIFFSLRKQRQGLLSQGVSFLRNKLQFFKLHLIHLMILALIMSSLGYADARFGHRFFIYRQMKDFIFGTKTAVELIPLYDTPAVKLTNPRVYGMTVPPLQAQDILTTNDFIQKNTSTGEKVFMFPQLATYSFIVDRPFVGRFPMATFSWIHPDWAEELIEDLKKSPPKIAVVEKNPGPSFPQVYFQVAKNKESFDRITNFINANYRIALSTPSLNIYLKK